jgi:hypothetical protein
MNWALECLSEIEEVIRDDNTLVPKIVEVIMKHYTGKLDYWHRDKINDVILAFLVQNTGIEFGNRIEEELYGGRLPE